MNARAKSRIVVMVLIAALLTASMALSYVVVAPNTASAQSNDATDTVTACNGNKIDVRPAEKRLLQLHNKERTERGKEPLCMQPQLLKAARGHAKDMIQNDYFSHESRNGDTFDERIRAAGYTSYSAIGENIGYGTGSRGSPGNLMESWMTSDGHRANLLNGRYEQVGIATYDGEFRGSGDARMAVVDFGDR